jgi:hypothetical protein
VVPSVTGGLTFFGAPLNNHMGHAAVAMVRRLREAPGLGLLYGQGGYVTAHHAMVLANEPSGSPLAPDYAVAPRRAAPPEVVAEATGPASLETFTVLFGRDAAPTGGIAILRTPQGGRLMARIPAGDDAGIARLTDDLRSPVGAKGVVRLAPDGLPEWSLA